MGQSTTTGAYLLAFLLTFATATLFQQLWWPLMFPEGTVGQEFIRYDLWKSILITGAYLLLLKKALQLKTAKALVILAACEMLTCVFLPLMMHAGNGRIELKKIISFSDTILPFILMVSAVYVCILSKSISKHIGDKQKYYGFSAIAGASMAFLFFILMALWLMLYFVVLCHFSSTGCSD